MLYYPQLNTGTVCQYPLSRRNLRRTIVNSLADGSTLQIGDDGAAGVRWTLGYVDLSDLELGAIKGLFDATSGSWHTFTFLDPTANLLTWSEDLLKAGWERDPFLMLTGAVPDPLGGTNGMQITNSGQVSQTLQQTLDGPSWFQYCLSIWIRSEETTTITLYATTGTEEIANAYIVGRYWKRLEHVFQMTSQQSGLSIGVRLNAGQRVELFGFQVEAQPAAGGYKQTQDRAGVYQNARFDQDILGSQATGINIHSCAVRIISNVAG